MKISYKGEYSLNIILYLSHYYGKELVHIEDISKGKNIPLKFLEQILLDLKKGGFVESRKGPGGGYKLSKKPSEIFVGDIVRFIDGSISPVPKKVSRSNKSKQSESVFDKVWQDVESSISDIIDNISFEQLKLEEETMISKEVLNYYI